MFTTGMRQNPYYCIVSCAFLSIHIILHHHHHHRAQDKLSFDVEKNSKMQLCIKRAKIMFFTQQQYNT